jgi:hypothetical protein
LAIVIAACDKNLDKSNPNYLPVDAYYKNAAELQAGTNAIYSVLHGGNLVGREWFFVHDTRGDEMKAGGSQLEQPRKNLLEGVHDPNNSVMTDNWSALYTLIHRANVVIANAPNVTDNDAVRNGCVAQAKFLRAWAYFDLVSQWGPVPVYTAPVGDATALSPRMPEADVYTQIIQDLNDAIPVLPNKGQTENGRVTKAAAYFLMGRAQMQKGDYAAAKAALLNITGYSLEPRYLNNFEEETEFNNESIFEVVYHNPGDVGFNWEGGGLGDGAAGQQTTVRNQEYCPVAWRNLIPSTKYCQEFERTTAPLNDTKDDPRFGYSVYKTGDLFNNGTETLQAGDQNGDGTKIFSDSIKVSWRKFQLIYKQSKEFASSSNHPGGNNQRLMRYADVLLMLAECENETGGTEATVIGYLNQVRGRSDVQMPLYPTARYPTNDKNSRTRAIMHERAVELGGEEVRNIDIMRWRRKGYYPSVVPEPLSYFVKDKHELLPIPQAELDNNPKLADAGVPRQNPNY